MVRYVVTYALVCRFIGLIDALPSGVRQQTNYGTAIQEVRERTIYHVVVVFHEVRHKMMNDFFISWSW